MRAALQPVLATSVRAHGFRDAPAGFPLVHLSVIVRGLTEAPMHPIVLLRRLTLETESYASTMPTVALRLRQARALCAALAGAAGAAGMADRLSSSMQLPPGRYSRGLARGSTREDGGGGGNGPRGAVWTPRASQGVPK